MDIQHDTQAQTFYVIVDDQACVLNYWKTAEALNLQRTYVPVSLRHRGIAAQIVRTALDYAKSEQLQIIPSCSTVKHYIDRHNEYLYLVN